VGSLSLGVRNAWVLAKKDPKKRGIPKQKRHHTLKNKFTENTLRLYSLTLLSPKPKSFQQEQHRKKEETKKKETALLKKQPEDKKLCSPKFPASLFVFSRATLCDRKNNKAYSQQRPATRTAPPAPLTRSTFRPESGVKRLKIQVGHMVRLGGTWPP